MQAQQLPFAARHLNRKDAGLGCHSRCAASGMSNFGNAQKADTATPRGRFQKADLHTVRGLGETSPQEAFIAIQAFARAARRKAQIADTQIPVTNGGRTGPNELCGD